MAAPLFFYFKRSYVFLHSSSLLVTDSCSPRLPVPHSTSVLRRVQLFQHQSCSTSGTAVQKIYVCCIIRISLLVFLLAFQALLHTSTSLLFARIFRHFYTSISGCHNLIIPHFEKIATFIIISPIL